MIKRLLNNLFNKIWYSRNWTRYPLLPLSWLFRLIVANRKRAYDRGWKERHDFSIPIIVIGNITVGGSGKTPLVIWMVDFLRKAGYRPGIISRGYGGKAKNWPQQVRPDSDPNTVGDEAVLLAQRCGCPIAVGPDRSASIEALLQHTDCNIIVSDDGLQHYELARDIEIAVIDGMRRFGNGCMLPAGPLREPVERLDEVDFVVTNGFAQRGEYAMRFKEMFPRNLESDESRSLERFAGSTVHAVAGIGNPSRFFSDLRQHGVNLTEHAFPDHYRFRQRDLEFNDTAPVLMTEKDAVKCRRFTAGHYWYIPIEAELNKHFGPRLLALLKKRESNG